MSTPRMARRGGSRGPRATRRAASRDEHGRWWTLPMLIVAGVLGFFVIAALVVLLLQPSPAPPAASEAAIPPPSSEETSDSVAATGSTTPSMGLPPTATIEVEVPNVVGKSVDSAEILLQVAGFEMVTQVAESAQSGSPADTVVSQSPERGARMKSGGTVVVTYNPRGPGPSAARAAVVVIDAGHQSKADLSKEPIGPGSKTMKDKVAGGASGVASGPEYHRTLEVSLKLRDKLEAAGVRVVMIRTSDDVNISNSQRAIRGNEAGADLVVRVHFDSADDRSVHGISTLFPSGNKWCSPIEPASKKAAGIVESAAAKATGAYQRGIFARGDMTGFNWSTRPTIIVECGFMSNPSEDASIKKASYQDKIASGISVGVLRYLASR